ncbi:MAG TPA: hypothetical protein VF318_01385, partial [Dehalococcoidales bacterium]
MGEGISIFAQSAVSPVLLLLFKTWAGRFILFYNYRLRGGRKIPLSDLSINKPVLTSHTGMVF